MRRTSLIICLVTLAAAGAWAHTTYTVPTDGTLQAVVAGAADGDEVYVLDGGYTLTSTLNINTSITL